jgi:hypothetical protein
MTSNFTKVSPTVLETPIPESYLELTSTGNSINDLYGKILGSYITGLKITSNTDSDHDIDISAGFCKDSTYEYFLELTSTGLTKQLDAEWNVGTNQGGVDLPYIGKKELTSTGVYESASTNYTSIATLDETRAIVAYRDLGNSSYGTACVLNIDGSVITPATPIVFNSAASSEINITRLDDTKAIVAYKDGGNSNYATAIVLNIDGDVITSTGSEKVFNYSNFSDLSITTIDSTRVIAAYKDIGNSNYGTAIVLNIDEDTITFGFEKVFNEAETSTTSIAKLEDTRAIVAYKDIGNSNYGTAIVLNIDEDTITLGSEKVFNEATTSYISIVALNSTKAVVAYRDTDDDISFYGAACALTIVGNTITIDAESVFSDIDFSNVNVAKLNDTRVIITDTNEKSRTLDVTGTTITLGGESSFSDSDNVDWMATAVLSSSQAIVAYADTDNSNYGTAIILDNSVLLTNSVFYPWSILKDSDNSTDILLSISSTIPLIPTGYTYVRNLPYAITIGDNGTINRIIDLKKYEGTTLSGYEISNNSTDSNHDIDIAPGFALSDVDDTPINLFTTMTKQLDALFAEGTNQGGLDTGTIGVSTWYYIYAIYNTSTKITDILFSASATDPIMPSNYTHKRRIRGAIYTDGAANILGFYQEDNVFKFLDSHHDLSTTAIGSTSRLTLAVTTPPEMTAIIQCTIEHNLAAYMIVNEVRQTDVTPSAGKYDLSTNTTNAQSFLRKLLYTDSSSQIAYRGTDANINFHVHTLGFIDPA